jgi:hypothetical protein
MERALILSCDMAVIRAEHLMLGESNGWQ